MIPLGISELMLLCLIALIVLAPLAVIAVLAAALISQSRQNAAARVVPPQDPVDILKRRYARGEITQEQFTAMRRDIEQ